MAKWLHCYILSKMIQFRFRDTKKQTKERCEKLLPFSTYLFSFVVLLLLNLFSQTDISRNYAKISRLNNYEAFIDLHSAGIDRDSNRESLQSIAIITRMIPVTTNCASSAFVLHVIFKKQTGVSNNYPRHIFCKIMFTIIKHTILM